MTKHSVQEVSQVFRKGRALINYLTAGYPTLEATYQYLFTLQRLGTDIIEIGVPFTDPTADGPTIQKANNIALENGVTLEWVLGLVEKARLAGLLVPVLLMGYYNVFYQYGMERLMKRCAKIGINGFIIVDLPPDLDPVYKRLSQQEDRALIALVSRNTPVERIKTLVSYARGFIYCLSVNGVTGSRKQLDPDLENFINRVRLITDMPLAVGFGISTPEQAKEVWSFADGIIMGSSIISHLDNLESFLTPFNQVKRIASKKSIARTKTNLLTQPETLDRNTPKTSQQNSYLPEILVSLHQELANEFQKWWNSPSFQEEFQNLLANYVGRPTPLYLAKNLSNNNGGASIWLKREDLNHTGSHKINNALGQALLAKKMGKTRIIAETGAGQHGIATATACSLLGLKCDIYMGCKDVQRQAKNVERIKLLGANLISVDTGSQTLREAINRALKDWVAQLDTTYYLIGSAIGAEPYPEMVAKFQSVIGQETRKQFLNINGTLPDYIVACVGGGSNAIGIFREFLDDASVQLVGVEAGGNGVENSASINNGSLGILHGTETFLLQDKDGQIKKTHSISAGLDYPGIGPEHSKLHLSKRAKYVTINDQEAVQAFSLLTETEGIIPALESAHAIAYALKVAKTLTTTSNIVVNLSGRGEKDIETVVEVRKCKM